MTSPGTSRLRNPPLPEAIHRYFELAIYMLVLTGFGTLASTGGLDSATVILVGAALILRGYLLAKRRRLMIPERWTTILTLGYVLFYLLDYMVLSKTFLSSTIHLVLFVMVVRLFSARKDRDQYFLSVIAFMMVLAAAVLTVDSVFLFSFAVFALMAVGTFILMEMRRSSATARVHSKATRDEWASRHMAFHLTAVVPSLVALIMLGAAGIFFVLPRISAGYLGGNVPSSDFSTGFSDQVQLGTIGEIQQSNSVVMHVQIFGDQSGNYDLYWRGVALSNFDGRKWSNPHQQHVVLGRPDGTFNFTTPDASPPQPGRRVPQPAIHYRVSMEPIGSNVFFLVPWVKSLDGAYRMLATDGGGAVYDADAEHPVNRYEAVSDLATINRAALREASTIFPPAISQTYLQFPVLDPRIPQLAETIAAGSSNDYDRALAIENYLRTKFAYSLQLSRTTPADPLANFLFERKQGHCEYFASSMAVMLRTLHIPARVVNGFHGGEFNDITSQYVVRASSAHSWVEAYFPGQGWVTFDPTPPGAIATHNRWTRMSLYLDAMSSFWRDWVVNFDAQHQQSLGRSATHNGVALYHRLQSWAHTHYDSLLSKARKTQSAFSDSPKRWSVLLVSTILALLLSIKSGSLLRELRKWLTAAHPEASPRAAATIWYTRMLRTAERHGWPKSAAQTPKEFAVSIDDPNLRTPIEQFTRHYESARFGESVEDAQKLPQLLEEIATTARK